MGDPLHKPYDQAVLSRSRRLSIAIILGILAAFGPLSMDMYLPALPKIAKDFHTNASFLQLTITFFVLVLASLKRLV
ncbi:hypothetical protein M3226_19675 [Neobacillus cucumis]|uniref:hypothetical protein n=1 Tax=Neobacillus cucumis TaxID=1740721 RepID=UPI00203BE902|nr:hypothetical protein [Neobacillus cucumis]MCM3727878.1 hypothetical protein [Neobacillus cucumis]